MKPILALMFIASLSVTRAGEKQDTADLIQHVAEYAATLKNLLEENWTVEAKDQVITLTSKFEVFYVTTPSSIGGGDPNRLTPPEFSDETSRNTLQKASTPQNYVIRLRFEKSMDRAEFDRRRAEKQKATDVLNFGSETKEEYGLAEMKYREIKLPTYSPNGHSYDVFQELPNSMNTAVHPPKSVQKIGGAKEILAVVLQKTLTAHD